MSALRDIRAYGKDYDSVAEVCSWSGCLEYAASEDAVRDFSGNMCDRHGQLQYHTSNHRYGIGEYGRGRHDFRTIYHDECDDCDGHDVEVFDDWDAFDLRDPENCIFCLHPQESHKDEAMRRAVFQPSKEGRWPSDFKEALMQPKQLEAEAGQRGKIERLHVEMLRDKRIASMSTEATQGGTLPSEPEPNVELVRSSQRSRITRFWKRIKSKRPV